MGRKMDNHKFLKLNDAFACINEKVSVIGVILNCSEPRKTEYMDYCCKLRIVDESHTGPGLTVNMYANRMDMLPHVASCGDIILLLQVAIKKHDDVYANFNKRFSSFVLYEGNDCEDFIPYQIYSQYSLREQDKKQIICLRNWSIDFKLDRGPTNFLLLRELKEENHHLFLVCKVLHKCEIAESKWMVFLWDGSDAPPRSLVTPLQYEMEKPLPLHLGEVSLSRDILRTFPVVGTILRVEVDESCSKHLHGMKTGSWVKLLNVSCKVEAGLWRVVVSPPFSKLRCLSNEDSLAVERERHSKERPSGMYQMIPYWSYPRPSRITEVDHDNVRSVSLMKILRARKVTAKFKATVRFLAASPWHVENFGNSSGIYMVRFTIEDATARIHAYVYAEDGDKFFGNFDADILTMKRNLLLGIERIGIGRNPPWVQCCIKAYYTDKQNQWGSRRYRIFGTKVVLPDQSTTLVSSTRLA